MQLNDTLFAREVRKRLFGARPPTRSLTIDEVCPTKSVKTVEQRGIVLQKVRKPWNMYQLSYSSTNVIFGF